MLINKPLLRGVFAYGNFCTQFFIFWRYKAISANNSKDLPINDEIKSPEVRVIGINNEQLGVLKIEQARAYADTNNVDLVLIAPTATPPVCRAIDYGKFCFERDKREKEAKKKQVIVKVKEVQLSCRIEQHDFDTRVNHAIKFLREGNKVKAVVRFRGREMSHIDLGRDVSPEAILEAVHQYDASIVGLSALMTTTVPAMEDTIKLLREKAPSVKIMVGGAVLTEEYAKTIGADFYGADAMEAVRYAEKFASR